MLPIVGEDGAGASGGATPGGGTAGSGGVVLSGQFAYDLRRLGMVLATCLGDNILKLLKGLSTFKLFPRKGLCQIYSKSHVLRERSLREKKFALV